jgi:hypothetical protein
MVVVEQLLSTNFIYSIAELKWTVMFILRL